MEDLLSIITSPWVWFVAVLLFTIKKGVYFVPQNRGYVIYTLGKYSGTLGAGLNFIIPFVQRVAADRNLKEQSLDIASQSAITKDNITLEIDGIDEEEDIQGPDGVDDGVDAAFSLVADPLIDHIHRGRIGKV